MRGSLAILALVIVSAPARADEVVAPKLTKAPVLVHHVTAEYPPAERAAGAQASVVLQLDLAADGHVTAAVVTTSAGAAFDAAAIAAALQFVFSPAEIDGKPAPIRILYQYDFTQKVEVAVKTTADFSGAVREREGRRPLAGVTITLETGATATTAADGRFSIVDVAPGEHTITLGGERITALQTTELLEAGKRLEVVYDVELEPPPGAEDPGDDLEIVVAAPRLEKAAASVEVVAGVARKVPGTGGDVLRVVENMPGVARATAGSGTLVVWGAAPEDTRVYVDGVRIPRLYHAGGLRSVVAADLVKSIGLVPGGWGAAHGRSLGGLVEVGLVPLDDKVGASASVDAIDTAAAVRFPIAPKLSAALAARKSQLAWVLDRVTSEDLGSFFPIPSYVDGQARLAYALSAHEQIEVVALGSSDRVTRTVANADPAATRSEQQEIQFWRAWVHHRRETGDAVVDSVVSVGADHSSHVERFGAAPTELETDARVVGARTSWRAPIANQTVLTLGLDAEVVDTTLRRRGSITVPPREGDVHVFGQPPPGQLVADRWRTVIASAAPFAELDAGLWGGRVHVIPGLRIEPLFTSVSRRTPIAGATPSVGLFDEDTTLQPRLALRLDPVPRVRIQAAVGRYRQAPQAEDLSAAFGTPQLPAAVATHWVIGAILKMSTTLTGEVTGFVTTSHDLAVRSPSSTPLLAEVLEPIGTGRVIGASALLRRELAAGVFGWVSYTLSRAERTDRPGAAPRLFDYDQTHVLTALVSWDLGHGIELGVRARYATGMPRTPVVSSYFNNRTDRYEPVFGAQNSERLPAFIQLDARLAKRLRVARTDVEIYLDLQNVTDRENAEELVYSTDFTSRSAIRGMPILPIVGARASL